MSSKICAFLIILVLVRNVQSALLYPQFTVMQLIGSVSVPITDLAKDRKVFFDWGLQMNYDMPYNISSFYTVPIWPASGSRRLSTISRAVHEHDFSAEDLYQGLANMLDRYGYDRSCFLQSICELSQSPFDEVYGNLVTDVLDFILKPSVHQGFAANRTYDGTSYSLAEDQGFLGKSCQELYPKCNDNLLNIFTVTEKVDK